MSEAEQSDTAREEVAATRPCEAPLPDPAGLGHALSPVDLPEPDQPLERPLAWTCTMIAVACALLALLNAEAIRGWSYELKPTAFNQRVVTLAEGWYDATAALGLDRPSATLRSWWQGVQAARFESDAPEPEPAQR